MIAATHGRQKHPGSSYLEPSALPGAQAAVRAETHAAGLSVGGAVAAFVVVLLLSFRALSRDLFADDTRPAWVVSACMSLLCLRGIDQSLARIITASYGAMGAALLLGLAGLVLAAYVRAVAKHSRRR